MAITKAQFKKTLKELLEQAKNIREALPHLQVDEIIEAADDLSGELSEMSETQQEKYEVAISNVDEVIGMINALRDGFNELDTAIDYLESAQEELENA